MFAKVPAPCSRKPPCIASPLTCDCSVGDVASFTKIFTARRNDHLDVVPSVLPSGPIFILRKEVIAGHHESCGAYWMQARKAGHSDRA